MKYYAAILIYALPTVLMAQTNTFPDNGKVGIGTVSPVSKLHLVSGSSGGYAHPYSDLIVEDSDHGMISILTPTTKTGYYAFSNTDDDFLGGMQYNHTTNEMIFRVNNHTNDMVINKYGSVGIGIPNPEYKLHVASGARLGKTAINGIQGTSGNGWLRDSWLTGNYGPPGWDDALEKWIRPSGTYNDVGGVVYQDEGTYFLRISGSSKTEFSNTEFLNESYLFASIGNGNIGIGTNSPDSKLTVKGKVHAEEVKIDLSVPGADYVFKEGYNLMSLEDIRQYIKEHGHLPNVPSAKDMEENGVDLGIMSMKLLEKIEELTLYTLMQNMEINELQKKNQELQTLSERVKRLESLSNKKD